VSLGAQLVALIGSAHALPTRSGSAAIVAALNCAELSPHAEVIMPAICCPAVFSSIAFAGFTPRLADVDLSDLCSGPAEIEAQISPRTAAIIAVHSYGRRCAIEEISSLAKDRGLLLIEDACLALGGGSDSRRLGSYGDFSILSFGYDKIIDSGGGGALLCNDDRLYRRARELLNANPFLADMPAENRKLVTDRLAGLPEQLSSRRENARLYEDGLSDEIVQKYPIEEDAVVWRYSVLYRGDRNALLSTAAEENIIITAHYPNLARFRTGPLLPDAETASAQVINFLVRAGTSHDSIERTIGLINEFDGTP